MKIVIHGQKAFGKELLERLLSNNENVVAVCGAPQKDNEPEDPLIVLAKERSIPVFQPSSWKTAEAYELMQSFEADICMMAYVTLLVPQRVIDAPRLGTFQFHPSLLPYHRGPSAISWSIAEGETMTGLSIFWPNEGLDEGDILMTKSCKIEPDDTLSSLYFNKLFPMGIDAMLESLELIKANIFLRYVQDPEQGTYESWFKKERAKIDWNSNVDKIYNTIRAANPAPGAWSMINNKQIDFFTAQKFSEMGEPGVIKRISNDGILIPAIDGSILIEKCRIDNGSKLPAVEAAKESSIKEGDTMSNNLETSVRIK